MVEQLTANDGATPLTANDGTTPLTVNDFVAVNTFPDVIINDLYTTNVETDLSLPLFTIRVNCLGSVSRGYTFALFPNIKISNNFTVSRSDLSITRVGNLISIEAAEYFKTQETFTSGRVYKLSFVEQFSTIDSWQPQKEYAFRESVLLNESLSKNINKSIDESFSFNEDFTANVVIPININESFSFSEMFSMNITKNISENFKIRDHYYENSNATLSEFKLLNTDIDDLEFERLLYYGAPVEYKDFRRFIAGDYDYQNAFLRYVFRSEAGDLARLNACKIIVDVPDVTDRGFVDCVDTGWVTVNFNRKFYVPPEIQVTLKSGFTIGAIPEVEAATLTNLSFRVRLKTASNNFIAGRVSWSALGY